MIDLIILSDTFDDECFSWFSKFCVFTLRDKIFVKFSKILMNYIISHNEDFFGRLEADGYIDGKIILKDKEMNKSYNLFKHTESVYALSLTLFDLYPILVSAAYDKLVCIWKCIDGEWNCVYTFVAEKPIVSMATSHKKELALVYKDGTVSTFSFTDSLILHIKDYSINNATYVTYHPMDCSLIASTKDGKIIDLDKHHTIQISEKKVNFIAYGDFGVAAICDDSTVKVCINGVVQDIPITTEKPVRLKWTPMTNHLVIYWQNSSEVWGTIDGKTWKRSNNRV